MSSSTEVARVLFGSYELRYSKLVLSAGEGGAAPPPPPPPDLGSRVDSTFRVVWHGSLLMCRYLSEREHLFRGRSCLELGCGAALPSSLLALGGARLVVASDSNADALGAAQETARLSGAPNVSTRLLEWSTAPPERAFELVLACDVVYRQEAVEPLLLCVRNSMRDDGLCLLSYKKRDLSGGDWISSSVRSASLALGLTPTVLLEEEECVILSLVYSG